MVSPAAITSLFLIPSISYWIYYLSINWSNDGQNLTDMATNWKDAKSIYEFNATTLDGEHVSMEKYRLVLKDQFF